jgi:hypothetical protein
VETIKNSASMKFSIPFITMTILGLSALSQGWAASPSTGSEKLTICDFTKIGKAETIKLSSLVENCSMVKFEDIDDALFKPWFTTVTDKYIGVRQQGSAPYKLFSHYHQSDVTETQTIPFTRWDFDRFTHAFQG